MARVAALRAGAAPVALGEGDVAAAQAFEAAREGDEVYEQHGLRVIVDSTSLFYIDGANIDYVDTLMGGGFHIDNPQATSSCGCGSSFRTAKTHDGEEVAEKSCGH